MKSVRRGDCSEVNTGAAHANLTGLEVVAKDQMRDIAGSVVVEAHEFLVLRTARKLHMFGTTQVDHLLKR